MKTIVVSLVLAIVATARAAPVKDCNAELAAANEKPLLGAFKPKCNADGTYQPEQCHEGYCYCVFPETGEQVLGTSVRFGHPKSCKLTKCILDRHEVMKKALLGAQQPQCSEDGAYLPMQCHHDGFCYCVNQETGEKISGVNAQSGNPDSCKLTPCVLARSEGMKKGLLGSFRPTCKADGSYESVQCHEGYCFCVFPNGEKVLGTSKRFARPKSCELTKCFLERHGGWKQVQMGLLGVLVPACEDDGKYKPVQCRKGMCWCVKPETGEPLPNTSLLGVPKC